MISYMDFTTKNLQFSAMFHDVSQHLIFFETIIYKYILSYIYTYIYTMISSKLML